MNLEPDYELDAYMRGVGEDDVLCDLRVWLPMAPHEDGRIEAVAMGVDASDRTTGLVSFFGADPAEDGRFRFEAREVLIRSSHSKGKRLAGGARLTIGHVGTLLIEHRRVNQAIESQSLGSLRYIKYVLSDLSYGLPHQNTTSDYKGNRTVEPVTSRILSLQISKLAAVRFSLERHWTWMRESDTHISAAGNVVLSLSEIGDSSIGDLAVLAEDTCLMLTLAARHLIVIHSIASDWEHASRTEWRNPLRRLRATTEEEACGPLVSSVELERYFVDVSPKWSDLDAGRRDAIRIAIYAIHPFSERSMEAGFLAMFSALEGLAKRWGKDSGKLQAKIDILFQNYPISIGGLWPLFDSSDGVALYWIRNELAHGRMAGRFADGALVLAHDHLQLWLEFALLAILGHVPEAHPRDWLRNESLKRRGDVLRMRGLLEKNA